MAQRVKTVEYAFDTRLTNLATNTTLGTSTRHDFSAITIYIPETSGFRVFRSVTVEYSWRDAVTLGVNFSGWRLGVKLGSTPFQDKDFTPNTMASTGDHECSTISHDVTAYFATNFGSGSSQTMQASFTASSSSATNVNNITAKVIITYEYDDSNVTQVKTVRVPIQSHHTSLTTSHVEVGTAGGTTNAPANQIPALDTFLPESSKTIRRAWIEVFAQDGGNATTDFNAFYQIDNATEDTRATLEQALITSVFYKDIFIYNTGTYSTSTAHAFKARSSLASMFNTLGAVLYVTYEFNASSSTTILNSLLLPLNEKQTGPYNSQTALYKDLRTLDFWVEEPGTPSLVQSGLFLYLHTAFGGSVNFSAKNQTDRNYTTVGINASGPHMIVHRADHGGGWSINRGRNLLELRSYGVAIAQYYGYAIINYTSDKDPSGVGVHNKSTHWLVTEYPTSGAAFTFGVALSSGVRTPNIPDDLYFINSVGFELHFRQTAGRSPVMISFATTSGEGGYGTGAVLAGAAAPETESEMGTTPLVFDTTSLWNRDSNKVGKLDIESPRHVGIYSGVACLPWAFQWMTHHNISYTVSGTVTGYTGTGAGLPVRIYSTVSGTLEAGATTVSGGFFTSKVFDNTSPYFVEVRQDSTHVGRSDNATPT